MLDILGWIVTNIGQGFINLFKALSDPMAWLDWSDKEALALFVYYGGSSEFFFAIIDLFLIIFVIGIIFRPFLWGFVRVSEAFANATGRLFAWAGLLMVLQQIMIIFLQRVFRVSEISLGPFGASFTRDLSWWSEELKLYNAMIVCLCCSYTFVQGGHVRVDLFYAGMRFRGKKIIDMMGSIVFIMPLTVMIWLFGWYFMWRNLVNPKVSAADNFDRIGAKISHSRWNIETIGFSPNGFDAYFLFKILLISFAGLMFLQGWTYFYRSFLEFVEGEESKDKYIDKDRLEDETADLIAEIH